MKIENQRDPEGAWETCSLDGAMLVGLVRRKVKRVSIVAQATTRRGKLYYRLSTGKEVRADKVILDEALVRYWTEKLGLC